jgi:DNA modification methylase
VLDPFAGVGGTLLGAALCGRKAVGLEINPEWIEIYRQVCSLEGLPEQQMLCGDSRELLRRRLGSSGEEAPFDLLLTDVPYWHMDRVPRSKGKYKRVGQPQRQSRVSKLQVFNEHQDTGRQGWRELLSEVFAGCLPRLKAGAYVVVFIGDMYHDGRFHFLAADLAALLETLGLVPKANLIWYDVSKSLHVYGYQYEFIPSMIHQNVLVFRKPRHRGGCS